MAKKTSKKTPTLIRFNTVKQYIIDTLKMRSADDSIKNLITTLTTSAHNIIKEAGKSAKIDKRNTIMAEDIQKSIENHLGKDNLSWQEVAQEIIQKNPTQLSNITKAINEHIQKKEK